MKFPRISFTKGTTLADLKKLYPSLQVCSVVIAEKQYLQAQVVVAGVGVLLFILNQKEELLEFEILPTYDQ